MKFEEKQIEDISASIYQRYIGSKIKLKSSKDSTGDYLPLTLDRLKHLDEFGLYKKHPLILRSLSSITDKEAEEFGFDDPERMLHSITSFPIELKDGFILMAKGFAIEQSILLDGKHVHLSVEQQVKLRIIELAK